jgi:hypothetical protein
MIQQIVDSVFSFLSPLRPVGPVTLALGITIVFLAILWLVLTERTKPPVSSAPGDESRPDRSESMWRWLVPLLLLIAAGGLLRLVGLGEKSLNHMEVYVPGMPLPAGISEPPPRHDWWSALSWGFFKEPHPVGYFLAMFAWTKLAGTSVAALRLPSALFGVLSIPVVYRLGQLTYGRTVGLIAAGFLALHGFHIHTSMWVRMFVPECFLGLVATWLLLEILRSSRRRGFLEALYVLIAVVGFNTEWFMWPLIGTHFLFALIHFRKNGETHRLLYLQTLAMILGGYTMSQVAGTAGLAASGSRPSLLIVREFLSFGLLYQDDNWSLSQRAWPSIGLLGLFLFAVALWWRGLRVRPLHLDTPDAGTALAREPLWLAAFGMTLVAVSIPLVAAGFISKIKFAAVTIGTVFPALAVATFQMAPGIGSRLRSWLDSAEERSPLLRILTSPIVFLAIVPFLMVCIGAFVRPIVDRQALIMFVPYVLIVLAAGANDLAGRTMLRAPLAIVLAGLFAASIWHFERMPQTPRDYAGLAQLLNTRIQPNDLIFVKPRLWYVTPFFYYVEQSRLVSDHYAAHSARPDARVWVILFGNEQMTPAMSEALTDFTLSGRVDALRSSALLYERR